MMNLISSLKKDKRGNPPLAGSMVDMTYKELEQAAAGGAAVLMPVSALEEYGPHLPVGTNAFLTNHLCLKLQENLWQHEKLCIIAPPVFWGRNHATGSFPGSFNLKSQTLISLLLDILSDISRWEFHTIILVNIHGDPQHYSSLIQAVRQAQSSGINALTLVPNQSLRQYNLTGSEDFTIIYNMPSFTSPSLYVDLHAGAFETSWLADVFPGHVRTALAKTLQSTKTTVDEASVWSKGWDDVKRAFPLGYCGNPSRIETKKAEEFEAKLVEQMTGAILLKGCI